ncbi:histidine phosphatase family protein [Candidatus Saccharibacteria bacterium]|nr:histidine phosphatase family protein [Candidatus Saccharibacteria bacterium]
MKRLYFVRHGQSVLNAQRILAGHIDTPLTETGRGQAKLAGEGARGLAIDCIVSSPLIRAHETARIVAGEIDLPIDKIELNHLVAERHYGELQGEPWDGTTHIDDEPSVEPLSAVLERARQTYAYVQTLPYDTVLIASHGTFGLALRAVIADEQTFEDVDDLPNAQIIQFV